MNEYFINLLTDRFAFGFYLGCVFLLISMYHHWKTRREFIRYQRLLSDKMELESKTMNDLKKKDKDKNKRLERMQKKMSQIENSKADIQTLKDLEIFTRAEKRMMVQVPGFVGAWQKAKDEANNELLEEESGLSLPKKIYQKVTGKYLPSESSSVVEVKVKDKDKDKDDKKA